MSNSKRKPKEELTDAQKAALANKKVQVEQLLKAADKLMQESPLFRARIRAAAKR